MHNVLNRALFIKTTNYLNQLIPKVPADNPVHTKMGVLWWHHGKSQDCEPPTPAVPHAVERIEEGVPTCERNSRPCRGVFPGGSLKEQEVPGGLALCPLPLMASVPPCFLDTNLACFPIGLT